jgi:DNA helicase II / ATP-dependent DNA helicase PcrA
MEEIFKKLYKGLNKGQKEAVDTIEGPVMVIAGPGTGKTTVLTLRIANILRLTDTPPSGILAITFTDVGVKRMRDKLREVIGNRAHEVEINTFHGFASAMIAEYPDHFPILRGVRQMSDVDQELLVREIIKEPKFRELRPSGKPDAYVGAIVKAIGDAKKDAMRPKDVRSFVEGEIKRVENDESSISTRGATKGKLKAEALEHIEKAKRTLLFADVYAEYEGRKRERELMDYDDLIIELLLALKTDELFLRLVQERYLYLLVDEHQDTNDAQNWILTLIAEFFDTPNLFIVGDEKQAIFRFQGASVENFLKLREKWPAMKTISLEENYRSHQAILDAGFSLIEGNYDGDEYKDLRIELKAKGSEKPRPLELVVGENLPAMENFLVKNIKDLLKKDEEANIALIVRRNRDLDRVIRLLESNNVPVSSQRSIDIFKHPVGVLFFELLQYLNDPSKSEALAKTLVSGMWGLSFDQGVKHILDLRKERIDLDKSLPKLKEIKEAELHASAVGFIIQAAELSGFANLVARDPNYVTVWRGITTLAESLAREQRLRSPRELVEAMLAYRQSAELKSVKVSVGAPDLPVQALTAHGAKGMEFDYVYIPYATDEAWIGRTRGSSFVLPEKNAGNDVPDLRRLFYVALTRAKKHVTILTAHEEADGKELTPLRFISELSQDTFSTVTLPREDSAYHAETHKGHIALANLAKDTLLDVGISVTALNHFLECPNKYLFESILKMPQAPAVPAEKGTAMHKALDQVWASEDKSARSIEKIIKKVTTESIDASLLSKEEKESVKEELNENVPIVAKALLEHFALEGQVYTERWLRAQFGHLYAKKHVSVPLHGRLDAIVDHDPTVSIFDYKTRQGMSEAEIRGETKSSEGNYFRQLVFYKLLVNADKQFRNRKTDYSLVFVSPDKKGRCPIITFPVTPSDERQVEKNVHTLIDSVLSGEVVTATCDDPDCKYCAWRSTLGN